ncbi:MAG: hypothetical protein Q9225_003945 [Loekoesia sp. 1 TL-2023]
MGSLPDREALKREGWYHDVPRPELFNAIVRDLFEGYSRIKPGDVMPHVLDIRDKAWAVFPWPCIGMFTFCDLSLSSHPSYSRVLAFLQNTENPSNLLDLGCCFGQDIRKVVHDGAPSENLFACDLNSHFLDLGYELFMDRDTLKARMIAADIFQDSGTLGELEGTLDFVHVSLFLHLFDWDRQVEACKRIVSLLKPVSGSTVLGRQTANRVAQEGYLPTVGDVWRHNDESFKKLWQQVGQESGTRWSVWTELKEREGKHQEPGFCFLTFEVKREE